MKNLSSTTKQRIIIISSLCVLFLFSWLAWAHFAAPKALFVVPGDVSQKLLFTPYVPSTLPQGYVVQTSSLVAKDGALFFTARKASSQSDVILVSEQSAPKAFDIDGFYKSIMQNPVRLQGVTSSTVFGARVGNAGTVIGITTNDNTWILVSSSSPLKKDDAKRLVTGLIPQQ